MTRVNNTDQPRTRRPLKLSLAFEMNQPNLVTLTPVTGENLMPVFDRSHAESNAAPIDQFIDKTSILNFSTKISDPSIFPTIDPVISNLVLLGYVSAVESYFRQLIRRIILFDKISQRSCANHTVTFGAASVHKIDMLPEAILEQYTFSSQDNIKEAYKALLDLSLGKNDNTNLLLVQAKDILKSYSVVCELRHCIVHRFGKLGTRNALTLDIISDAALIEKPIKFDYSFLQTVLSVCTDTVKVMNNFTFVSLLERLVLDEKGVLLRDTVWTWDYRRDRAFFEKYFNLFYSNVIPPMVPQTAKVVYYNYRQEYRKVLASLQNAQRNR